jgi:hypothetical protein
MDEASKKGELFGLENLFTFQESDSLLRKIMHQTNVAESRAGVDAIDFNFDEAQPDDEDEDILSNTSLGIDDDAHIKALADALIAPSTAKRPRDPIAAILTKAGVSYTHENSEVIGHSEIEARLGKQAMELRNDLSRARSRVFVGSQSQSQPRVQRDPDAYESDGTEPDEQSIDLDVNPDDDGDATRSAALRINYRYRPDERVRRRLFCGLAASMGFEDVVEFALLVEGSSQVERRKMLERFYRARRRAVGRL